jgi:hypothetical protein
MLSNHRDLLGYLLPLKASKRNTRQHQLTRDGFVFACNAFQQTGLSTSIGANDGNALTIVHIKCHVGDGSPVSQAISAEPAHRQYRFIQFPTEHPKTTFVVML